MIELILDWKTINQPTSAFCWTSMSKWIIRIVFVWMKKWLIAYFIIFWKLNYFIVSWVLSMNKLFYLLFYWLKMAMSFRPKPTPYNFNGHTDGKQWLEMPVWSFMQILKNKLGVYGQEQQLLNCWEMHPKSVYHPCVSWELFAKRTLQAYWNCETWSGPENS